MRKAMESNMYTVNGKEFELQHYGVKGMKWGRRKARPEATGNGRRGGQTDNSPEAQAAAKEARRQKAKRALKIGAAVVGTALAAYGAVKLHSAVREKNYQYRMAQGSKAIDQYIKKTTTWSTPSEDWRVRMDRDARDQKYFEQVYKSASRQADKDSFRTAVRNVVTDYLDKNRR